ncbi:MAG: peroxiredoxin [Sporomusaceae bacterium]|jgi:peroxiredoxin Q/BCP|nr:peroxiredoxin [Sporomusaceae bacterium]
MTDTAKQINVGDLAPDFTLLSAGGKEVTLSQLRSKTVVLYFYSKNNTAGCTNEALEFRDTYAEFTALNAIVVGISRDPVTSHEKFIAKHQLPFILLSDAESKVSELYGVLKLKNMYGKKVMGIERSTFIINPDGVITNIFRKVKVAGHAKACLAALS